MAIVQLVSLPGQRNVSKSFLVKCKHCISVINYIQYICIHTCFYMYDNSTIIHILCIHFIDRKGDLPEQKLQLECAAVYNPEDVMYNITVMWNLTNLHPLVVEVLHAHYYRVFGQEFKIPITNTKQQFIMSQVALNFTLTYIVRTLLIDYIRHKNLFSYM